MVASLREALPHCANEEQRAMIEKYMSSFELGCVRPQPPPAAAAAAALRHPARPGPAL